MLVLLWITIGALQMDIKYPTLPPPDVSRCSAAATNNTLLWQQSTGVSDWTTTALISAHRFDETNSTVRVIVHVFLSQNEDFGIVVRIAYKMQKNVHICT